MIASSKERMRLWYLVLALLGFMWPLRRWPKKTLEREDPWTLSSRYTTGHAAIPSAGERRLLGVAKPSDAHNVRQSAKFGRVAGGGEALEDAKQYLSSAKEALLRRPLDTEVLNRLPYLARESSHEGIRTVAVQHDECPSPVDQSTTLHVVRVHLFQPAHRVPCPMHKHSHYRTILCCTCGAS